MQFALTQCSASHVAKLILENINCDSHILS